MMGREGEGEMGRRGKGTKGRWGDDGEMRRGGEERWASSRPGRRHPCTPRLVPPYLCQPDKTPVLGFPAQRGAGGSSIPPGGRRGGAAARGGQGGRFRHLCPVDGDGSLARLSPNPRCPAVPSLPVARLLGMRRVQPGGEVKPTRGSKKKKKGLGSNFGAPHSPRTFPTSATMKTTM